MALDRGVVQLLVCMPSPDGLVAVVDVELSEIGCGSWSLCGRVSVFPCSCSSWMMGGVVFATLCTSISIVAEWILLVVAAFGVLVMPVGSVGGLSTGLVANHRPSRRRFMAISDMVVP